MTKEDINRELVSDPAFLKLSESEQDHVAEEAYRIHASSSSPMSAVSQAKNVEQDIPPPQQIPGRDARQALASTLGLGAETVGGVRGAAMGAARGAVAGSRLGPLGAAAGGVAGGILGAGIGGGIASSVQPTAEYGLGLRSNLTPQEIGQNVMHGAGMAALGESGARAAIGTANAVMRPMGRALTGSKQVTPEDLRIASEAEKMGVQLRPSEISQSDTAAQIEMNAARSLFGKAKFQSLDIKNEAAFRQSIESYADQAFGQAQKQQTAGRLVQEAIEGKATPDYQMVNRGLYRNLDSITGDEPIVQTHSIFKQAHGLTGSIDEKLYPKAYAIAKKIEDQVSAPGPVTGLTVKKQQIPAIPERIVEEKDIYGATIQKTIPGEPAKLGKLSIEQRSEGQSIPKAITFMTAHDLRSLMLEITRTGEGLPKRQQSVAAGLANSLDQAMSHAAQSFDKQTGKGLYAQWRVANASTKAGHELFDSAIIRSALKANPEDVVAKSFAKNAITETDHILEALKNYPQDLNVYRRAALESLQHKAMAGGDFLNGQAFYNAALGKNGVGEEVMQRTFGKNWPEIRKFLEVGRRMNLATLPTNAGNPSQTGRSLINWFEQGMVVAIPTSALSSLMMANISPLLGSVGTAGTYYVTIKGIANLLNSPKGVQILRQGWHVAPNTERGLRIGGQILSILSKSSMDEPKPPTPSPAALPRKFGPGYSIPQYKDGTDYVPKTGPAVLHQGEMVIPKVEADKIRGEQKKWSLFAYGGKSQSEQFNNAHGTGDNANVKFPNLSTRPEAIAGARLQYEVNPNLALALEAWRNNSQLSLGMGPPGYRFHQDLFNISPSVQARLPLGPVTPYVGAGPVVTRNQQGDGYGNSPPSLNLGYQAYGGLDIPITDALRAMIEMKYHDTKLTPQDQQGAINGNYSNLSVLGGLGYKF